MSEEKRNPGGQPTYYTVEIAEEICRRLAEPRTLKSICQDEDMPPRRTVYQWLMDNEDFSRMYAKAKEQQVDAYVDEIFEIADDTSKDTLYDKNGNKIPNSEWIARSRLRADTRKWFACKVYPKVYGERKAEGSENAKPPQINTILGVEKDKI